MFSQSLVVATHSAQIFSLADLVSIVDSLASTPMIPSHQRMRSDFDMVALSKSRPVFVHNTVINACHRVHEDTLPAFALYYSIIAPLRWFGAPVA